MTDRELLEAAARAAGISGYIYEGYSGPVFVIPGPDPVLWSPLTDDGDALRLANALRINIEHTMSKASGGDVFVGCQPRDYGHFAATEGDLSDYNAATRRAITRAAAALSEQEVLE